MANIFISYSSTDKTIVQQLAHLLEQKGWTVWWDRQIPIGQHFDEVIEHELNESDCALVIWTAKSVASEWVRAEAGTAATQKKLVPIMLEQVTVPLAFRNMEAALLIDWDGSQDHPELELLYQAIESTLLHNKQDKKTTVDPVYTPPHGYNKPILTPNRPSNKLRNSLIGISSVILLSLIIFFGWQKMQVKKPEHGIKISGKVKTAAEQPINKAEINVEGTKHVAISSTDGSYNLNLDDFKLGEEVTISTSHPDFEDKFFFFKPESNEVKEFDIYLNPISQ